MQNVQINIFWSSSPFLSETPASIRLDVAWAVVADKIIDKMFVDYGYCYERWTHPHLFLSHASLSPLFHPFLYLATP